MPGSDFAFTAQAPLPGRTARLEELGCEARLVPYGESFVVQTRQVDRQGKSDDDWTTVEEPDPDFILAVGQALDTWIHCATGPCSSFQMPTESCSSCGTVSLDEEVRAACGLALGQAADPGPCNRCTKTGTHPAYHFFVAGWHIAPLCADCVQIPGVHLARRNCTVPAHPDPTEPTPGPFTIHPHGLDYEIHAGNDVIAVVLALKNQTPAQTAANARLLALSCDLAKTLAQWAAKGSSTPSKRSALLVETRRLLAQLPVVA